VRNYYDQSAEITDCGKYRYVLWRTWDKSRPWVLFVCLNPSTADGQVDDPTVGKCVRFAESWGFGGVRLANLFALRSSTPKRLIEVADPVGPENDCWLRKLGREAGLVVAAWGNHGKLQGRSNHVVSLIDQWHCISVNKTEEPAHPLFLSGVLKPIRYIRR
jgi:hypothetical protein